MLGGGGVGGADGEDGDIGADEFPPASVMGRRRSRAVLYQLSGHYKPEKVKTKLKINNVSPLSRVITIYISLSLPPRSGLIQSLPVSLVGYRRGAGELISYFLFA